MLTCGEDLIEDYVDRYVARQSEQEGIERERKDRYRTERREIQKNRGRKKREERESLLCEKNS